MNKNKIGAEGRIRTYSADGLPFLILSIGVGEQSDRMSVKPFRVQ